MQVGEAVAEAIIIEQHDPDCYFCNANDEPEENENDLDDDYDDDEDLTGLEAEGIKFKNDASKLGSALGKDPGKKKVLNKENSSAAAHHLIPGNASLAKSDLFECKKYLWDKGKKKGNIKYNINSAPNGVWLPGNYAIRPWGEKGAAYVKDGGNPKKYAFASINAWGAQFHDAHEDYSTFVTDALDKLKTKLDKGEAIWCPKAKKQDDDPEKRSPLYVLVNRLHTISGRMRSMLTFPTKKWKRNIWTSAYSLLYINEQPHRKKASPSR